MDGGNEMSVSSCKILAKLLYSSIQGKGWSRGLPRVHSIESPRRFDCISCYTADVQYRPGRRGSREGLGKIEKRHPGTVIIVRNFIDLPWTEDL